METTPYHLMRPKQAAGYFGIGISTLWHWLKTRPDMPRPIHAGLGVTLIDVAATEKYLRSQSLPLAHSEGAK